jgi:hypothetical protein
MAIFPDTATIKPLIDGYDPTPIENVKRNESESGKSQKRDVWGRVRRMFQMEFRLQFADSYTLQAFCDANRALDITFFDYESNRFAAENIGTGTGALAAFTVPAKEIKNATVYVNNVPRAAGIDYTISAGSGALTEDRIIFVAGHEPPNGQAVTIFYDGRHRYTVEFVSPPQVRPVEYNQRSHRIALREVF